MTTNLDITPCLRTPETIRGQWVADLRDWVPDWHLMAEFREKVESLAAFGAVGNALGEIAVLSYAYATGTFDSPSVLRRVGEETGLSALLSKEVTEWPVYSQVRRSQRPVLLHLTTGLLKSAALWAPMGSALRILAERGGVAFETAVQTEALYRINYAARIDSMLMDD